MLGTTDDGGVELVGLRAHDLTSPGTLEKLLGRFRRTAAAPVFLGPRLPEDFADSLVLPLPAPRCGGTPDPAEPAEIGIVDAGIAFWNPAFDGRFASVGGLATVRRPAGSPPTSLLTKLAAGELTDMAAIGGDATGDAANRARMATILPQSVFAVEDGRPSPVRPESLSHGTAMADFVLQTAHPEARLHGLELPVSVLRDATCGALRGLLDAAIRGVVSMAADRRHDSAPFRIVVLVAYGFTGGPQDGDAPDVIDRLRGTISEFAAIGIIVQVVLAMGNHLQDQGHARLDCAATTGAERWLDWRILPDDHSANAVDLVHAEGVPALEIVAPDRGAATRPASAPFAIIRFGTRVIGAILTVQIGGGRARTRITLTATAARNGSAPCAPFGRWRLRLAEGAAMQAWVLRDDSGFEDDRAAPHRRSWFEDPAYRARGAQGLPGKDDMLHPASSVRREGSASLLAAFADAAMPAVGAQWQAPGVAPKVAPYSGLYLPSHMGTPDYVVVEAPAPFAGRLALGNGSGRPFRVSGTSVASALRAGTLSL